MKILFFIFLTFLVLSCSKEDNRMSEDNNSIPIIEGQNISTLIAPIETDTGYSSADREHYVVRNTETHLNKLLLFIGGSFSTPQSYSIICDHAASIGLDVISISYPNNVPAAPLGASEDPFIFDNYREEICFGNPLSDVVDVNDLNSINTRAIRLLEHLNTRYPDQNWGQYLTESNTLAWNNIIVSGHSQGAGHAGYFGKQNLVDKVVMFSGPNDFSTFFNAPANWLTQNGATPLNKHFALLHEQDNIVAFDNQLANIRGLGLLTTTESPTLADDLVPPYENAKALSLNISAISNHNAPIGSNDILPDIWSYMFLDN